jgi:hypothetical protein
MRFAVVGIAVAADFVSVASSCHMRARRRDYVFTRRRQ